MIIHQFPNPKNQFSFNGIDAIGNFILQFSNKKSNKGIVLLNQSLSELFILDFLSKKRDRAMSFNTLLVERTKTYLTNFGSYDFNAMKQLNMCVN